MKNTYKVTYAETYKWAYIEEVYTVEATSEDEARDIIDEGGGTFVDEERKIVRLANHKGSEFVNIQKVTS
tara:strand:- start:2632 stop:2841 length:210 start_codon:yes stop_codon:yes gene_type:complete